MEKHLYFICPTDKLETKINSIYKQENYYCSSLANSITFDSTIMEDINSIIERKNIKEITFILSSENEIISDVLSEQNLIQINGLSKFYYFVNKEMKYTKVFLPIYHNSTTLISSHLKKKISELQNNISCWLKHDLKINAKIYYKANNKFRDINDDLFFGNFFSLN